VCVKFFRCFGCNATYLPQEVESLPIMRCDECGSALDAEYDYDSIRKEIITDSFRRDTPTHWKYWPFLPISDLSSDAIKDSAQYCEAVPSPGSIHVYCSGYHSLFPEFLNCRIASTISKKSKCQSWIIKKHNFSPNF